MNLQCGWLVLSQKEKRNSFPFLKGHIFGRQKKKKVIGSSQYFGSKRELKHILVD